jgi:hypothetical protein
MLRVKGSNAGFAFFDINVNKWMFTTTPHLACSRYHAVYFKVTATDV